MMLYYSTTSVVVAELGPTADRILNLISFIRIRLGMTPHDACRRRRRRRRRSSICPHPMLRLTTCGALMAMYSRSALGWAPPPADLPRQQPLALRSFRTDADPVPRTHPTFSSRPLDRADAIDLAATPPAADAALSSLASTVLALLAGNEEAAEALGREARRDLILETFQAYDVCHSGTLDADEARSLFVDLARSIVRDVAEGAAPDVARAHARRVLAADEAGNTVERIATKLLLMADPDGDGRVSLTELADMFDAVRGSREAGRGGTFPQPLRALAGSLQLLPPTEGVGREEAAARSSEYHMGVPGDDHTLRTVRLDRDLSIVGVGRSADASTYFLPELGLVLDAGMCVKSLRPRTVLLTHGHRDHISALPAHAAGGASIVAPRPISGLVRRFLLAEAQLNYGDEGQTDQETVAALGEYDIRPVEDGDTFLLPREGYAGSPTPLGVQVFRAPHKDGVPSVSYGLYRAKNRIKAEYAALPKSELGSLIQNDVTITERHDEGLLFYTGDTTINLLRERWQEILPKYRNIIHEVTFLGKPSSELDESSRRKGHTHYSQLHPWICAFPETTFICVHWSLRYSREDILKYFEENYGGVPKNVVLWI